MHTRHEWLASAPPETVFAVAADVERWPSLHRAYRWCRVLERAPDRIVFEMAGRIRGWPARWTAVQERDASAGRIVFHHTKGITTGMRVEWQVRPRPRGTSITLSHDLVMRWPVVGRLVSNLIVGPIFIDWIARHTLRVVAQAAEGMSEPNG